MAVCYRTLHATLLATLTFHLFCASVLIPSSVATSVPLSTTSPAVRFMGVGGIGVDEPYPDVRVFAYTPRGSFNPSSAAVTEAGKFSFVFV
ncbi:membrane protein, putative [Babesia bigemina]|uniref:Membrane protein, putative n=1 Tax=Babesia bigemina TaxID=5866 RepID=A0A061DDK1_BABBI|nr:membrane protein, putative [Babesia bigemina]CDR96315.1 membrane protein, putative [Babesia bigemina]|eukprot:XP_012768501.1 membrane protein, putative [Babesia bigemina]